MGVFSDDDLKRLKEYLEREGIKTFGLTNRWLNFPALLSRLEAAENIVAHVSHVPSEVKDHYLEIWRKAAGK